MPTIALDLLDDHPDNANRMGEDLLAKLVAHIRDNGKYPPLIIRPHPQHAGRYQILDGHHRAKALHQLGRTEACCEIWDVDEAQTDLLLLTLNRLCGEDDPYRRGALLKRAADLCDLSELAAKLPEDVQKIRKLIEATQAPPSPAPPPDLASMPQAVTFFLTAPQRDRLFDRLKAVARDRSEALVALLELGSTVRHP
ncbi:MAG: ParB N-terminal domain-containing protein [Planctomycetes bacterium]|nr:ParB N-terminal domain-containing protein [Planctomycetota bacterium]